MPDAEAASMVRVSSVLLIDARSLPGEEVDAPASRLPDAGGGAVTGATVSSVTVGTLMRVGGQPVDPDDRLAVAAARMRHAHVAALAVIEVGRLVGLISERELITAVADGLSTDVTRVRDYMLPVPGVLEAEAEVSAAAARMIEMGVRHLLVVRNDEIVGLISASDLLSECGVPRALLDDAPL